MRFEELVEINPKVKIEKGQEYPFVEMDAVEPSRRYVQAKKNREFGGGGSKFRVGDTLFARITPCLENGKIAQFVDEENQLGFGSTEFIVFRAKQGISDPSFIYYLARTNTIRGPAEKSMSGASGRQRADAEVIRRIEIDVLSLDVQRQIGAILSAYDDLIENNLRRIKILEEMAQTLYREWFVKFRFPACAEASAGRPGHQRVKMVDSPMGKIPEGWEIRQVDEVIETLGGGTPSTKEPSYWEGGNIDWYSPSDLTAAGSMFITGSSKKITQLGLEKSSAKFFPAYSLMMTSRATIGVISINTGKACTNQGFITCIPNDRLSVFHLYFWIKESREKIISVASGATFKEISRGEFREFTIVVPPLPIENTFTETVEPMCRVIENLIKKNHNLVITRNLLLPKLISGELDVSELDIMQAPSPSGRGLE